MYNVPANHGERIKISVTSMDVVWLNEFMRPPVQQPIKISI